MSFVYIRAILTARFSFVVCLALAASVGVSNARGESIRDAVRKHVQTGLEGSKGGDKPKTEPAPDATPTDKKPDSGAQEHPPVPPPPPPPAPKPQAVQAPPPPPAPKPQAAQDSQPTSGVRFEWSSSSDSKEPTSKEPPPEEPPGPSIPQRVFGEYFRLDPKLGGGLRGWIPAQYPTVKAQADTYYTWSLELKATLFRYVNIHRGYYESNGISGPRHQGAAVAVEGLGYAKKAAWLLGVIGVPITKVWEPIIRYETRAFETRAIPRQPVRIVPFDTSPDTDLSTIKLDSRPLTMVSGFETLVIAMSYNHSAQPSTTVGPRTSMIPPFYFGVGFTQYSKPYQVTVGDSVLDSILFDARFRGAGIALGTTLPSKPDFLILDASVQFGLGEVRLLDRLTLNELLPNTPGRGGLRAPEWVIGYLEGDLSVGYLYTLLRTKPSVLVSAVANGGGARFFYVKTQSEQGEKVNMPSLNWDFLWGVRAYVTVPF